MAQFARAVARGARFSRDFITLGYPVSLFFGFWVLRAYCYSSRIPVPDPDASLLVCLALLGFGCFFALLWLLGGPLGIFALVVASPEVRALRPVGAASQPSFRDVRRFGKRWLLMFLPFVLSSCSACATWVVAPLLYSRLASNPVVFSTFSFNAMIWIIAVVCFAFGLLVSTLYYKYWSERFMPSTNGSKNDVPTFAFAAMFISAVACCWVLIAVGSVLFFTLGGPLLQVNSSTLYLLVIYGLLLLWLPVATFLALWERFQAIFAVGLMVVFAVMLVSAPRLGGLALRVLGYGGGIPISLVAKVMDAEAKPVTERIDGCLVLWTGAQITILRPLAQGMTLPPCHFNPRTPNDAKGQPIATSLDTISRVDLRDVFFIGKR